MVSLHQLGIIESLHMAAILGCSPREVVIIAIQPKTICPGLNLSAELQATLPRAVQAVLAEVQG